MKTRPEKKERYVAVEELELAISAFAEAMRQADVSYIARGGYTPNLSLAWDRYVNACTRLTYLK